jgi:predicted O-linked N-acetylglucosamine transferase (SPINDLY family)
VLAAHDRARVEVVAISVGPPDADAGRARVIAAADRFVDLHDRPDAAISDALAALRLDVLVEISGHAAHARLAPLARRPAPVQASWLGYAGTLAAPGIDWLIADEVVVPRSEQCHYAERIVRLPGGFFPHRAVRAVDAPLSRAAYGLPETGPVLCSFNALFKLTPPVFGAWLDALVARPDAVLWMAAAPCAHERLRAIAVDRGVAPARLVFAGRVDSDAAHLARYRVADLLLDTFPFGSHTTASDALWAGCPLLALRGRTFASRVAASILHAEGLPDLVVDGLDAYRERLVSLLADPTRLAALRARLRTPGGAAPEPATLALARALEDAYVELRTEAAR